MTHPLHQQMKQVLTPLVLLFVCSMWMMDSALAASQATGVKVGEVTSNSAIVWTRVTKFPHRVEPGYREPVKRTPRVAEYVPSEVPIEKREGAAPGLPGFVRLTCAPILKNRAEKNRNSQEIQSEWIAVDPKTDFTHQFRLRNLVPGTRYQYQVESRPKPDSDITCTLKGTFRTAEKSDVWQNVRFAVVTGQSYWDLDHAKGYHIYPAMQKLNLDFLVPTGDTVYLDSEAPRARTVDLARYHWHRMYSLPRHIEFHRHVPGYWEKDDHDAWCNDCWPSMKAPWMNPLTFQEGLKVFREQVPMGENTFRTFRWGSGLQIWLVEGRDFRSPNNMKDGPEKSIWGEAQRKWLINSIQKSDADFKVLISPTPIVGPDRSGKADNHANRAFTWEGDFFRNWTRRQKLKNFFVCCGDRHWQYLSMDPKTGLREFSCGPASDQHAGGSPKHDPDVQPFHRQKGGFLSVTVKREDERTVILFRHHDVHGKTVHEFRSVKDSPSE